MFGAYYTFQDLEWHSEFLYASESVDALKREISSQANDLYDEEWVETNESLSLVLERGFYSIEKVKVIA